MVLVCLLDVFSLWKPSLSMPFRLVKVSFRPLCFLGPSEVVSRDALLSPRHTHTPTPTPTPTVPGKPMEPPGQSGISTAYIPTEDEKRVFRECNAESFWYRSLPFSAISMLATQMLIKKGIFTTRSRFGSLPKVAFAGFCGYVGGKISYMKTCQEKFKQLENSPLGEALRKQRLREYNSQQRGFSNVPSPFENAPAAPPEASQPSKFPVDNYGMIDFHSKYEPVPFSSSMNESTPTGITDSLPQEPIPSSEGGPKRKGITYDELRSRNREMYEAGIMQKSDVPSKPLQERPLKKEAKVNKYGDAWEE